MISIAVHGGAGARTDHDDAEGAIDGCLLAARAGYEVLRSGGSAIDAVLAATELLENDPRFNAGYGSALTQAGTVEMDASIMNGADLSAGAVAVIRSFRNPVRIAHAVMRESPHVFLVDAGAEAFARAHGFEVVSNESMIAPRARRQSLGTVGAVARDRMGHLAAATSTGGTRGKLPGRVGDSPLIGCGTYANDASAAVSATGLGEAIIRVTLARHVADLVATSDSVQHAADAAIATLRHGRGSGGVIVMPAQGSAVWSFNTERMARASIDETAGERAAFE